MKKFLPLVLTILILFCFFSVQAEENVLNVLTYSSFAVSEDVIKDFRAENNVKVQFIEGGDTPSVLIGQFSRRIRRLPISYRDERCFTGTGRQK